MSVQESEETFEIDETSASDANESNSSPDTLRILEALLFASDELMTAARLKTILPGNPDARQIRKMADKINVQLQKERHPFEIVEIGGGYQFRTVSFYHTWVRQIFKEKASKKLSVQALECLAIIAYKQPLSKAEIEAIRGVVSDGAMKTLLEKHLVAISGRSEKPGRPLLYATSGEFLKYFGLNKIADLPRIEEFEAIAREKMEELSIEELSVDDVKTSDVEANEDAGESRELSNPEGGAELAQGLAEGELCENKSPQEIDSDIPPPQATAVFEISIDEKMESEFESQDEDALDDSDEIDFETEENMDAIQSESTSFEEEKTPFRIEKKDPEELTDTFDLEISFDSEDVEQMLPSELSALSSQAALEEKELTDENEMEIFEQLGPVSDSQSPPVQEKTAADDEYLLEPLLPEDSIDGSEGDSSGKKQ